MLSLRQMRPVCFTGRANHQPNAGMIPRRTFFERSGRVAVAAVVTGALPSVAADPQQPSRMNLDLNFPKLGMTCDQRQAVELAAQHGFSSVSGDSGQLARMTETDLASLDSLRLQKGLVWGTTGCPVDFRRDDATFDTGLAALSALGPKLKQLGLTRLTTWISPAHSELTYLQNFARHVDRMKRLDEILGRFELRLGLEYVGTQLGRFNRKHGFIHTAAEVLELIAAADASQLGLILDSWHWWTTGETAADLASLKAAQVVSVELNDAPEGLAREQQIDNRRRLPASTGVLPVADFLKAVANIGFDGPVMAEPFYAPLREGTVEAAAEQVAAALKRAFAQLS
jgi:sugar phosphate isomerase/epimerase